MFGPNHYVPVLKWKQGEQNALAGLPATVKSNLTPLIELVSIPVDLETREPRKTLERHVTSSIDQIINSWGTEQPFFLDCGGIGDSYSTAEGLSGPEHAFDLAAGSGLAFIPTVRLYDPEPVILSAVNHSTRGICIRIELDDAENADITTDLQRILEAGGISHDNVDIVMDLGTIEGAKQSVARHMALSFMSVIPSISGWRNLILTASSFPRTMGVVDSNSYDTITRVEWEAWKSLYSQRHRLQRLPTFGDYGIQHPELPELFEDYDPRIMPSAAAIRYAFEDSWVIVKGHSLRDRRRRGTDYDQFYDLSASLTHSRYYYGRGHCVGCTMIDDRANRRTGPGSQTTWRTIGTAHHITVVTEQLEQLTSESE